MTKSGLLFFNQFFNIITFVSIIVGKSLDHILKPISNNRQTVINYVEPLQAFVTSHKKKKLTSHTYYYQLL